MSQEYGANLVDKAQHILGKNLPETLVKDILEKKSTPRIQALRLFVLNSAQGQHTGKNRNKLWTELQNLLNKPKDRANLHTKLSNNLVNTMLLAPDIMPSQWREVLQDVQEKTKEKRAPWVKTQTTTQPGKPNQPGRNVTMPRQTQRLAPQAQPLSLREITDVFDKFKARKKAEAERQKAAEAAGSDAAAAGGGGDESGESAAAGAG